MTEDIVEIGDLVEFSAEGKYGPMTEIRGLVVHVYLNGKIRVATEFGKWTVPAVDVILLSKGIA